MQANTYFQARDLASQRTTSEMQLSNFFKHYPLEYIQEHIVKLLENIIPNSSDCNDIPLSYLFYEEFNHMLQNYKLLYKFKNHNTHEHQLLSTYEHVITIVDFLKEVIPSSYIFCTNCSKSRTDLIIVMDKHKYKPFDEIYTLLDFALLGHKQINCTVYSYSCIYDFLSRGHLYFSSICTLENCIYQNNSEFNLPELTKHKCAEMLTRTTPQFRHNIQKATTFFNTAIHLANENEITLSAFMAQQACELTFRSLLLTLRGKQVKCHDLVVLRKHLIHFAPEITGIIADEENIEIKILSSIQEAYIKSRYDQTYNIGIDELQDALLAAEKLISTAQKIFNYHCDKIKKMVDHL